MCPGEFQCGIVEFAGGVVVGRLGAGDQALRPHQCQGQKNASHEGHQGKLPRYGEQKNAEQRGNQDPLDEGKHQVRKRGEGFGTCGGQQF